MGAVGLSPEQSQFLVDRISQRANDLGLSAGRPGCDANIVVSFTADPNGVAAAITRSRDFNAGGRGRTRDRATLRSFTEGREPVRWWYVWQTVADTGELANRDEREGGRGPEVTVQDRGRVGSRTRDDMSNVFVVIDGPQIANVNMNALADYIAMVSLGQFDADTTTGGQPSILNLFRDRTPQTALTDWDRQTLRALYR
ncbi:MAG TPA: hypothetical protein PKY87_14945 [Terricaulis sp.]|nr:hypothetical protein [Terricaulis sp.]